MMHRPFCLVYYHTAVHLPPVPNFAWVARLHHVLGPRHRRNLQVSFLCNSTPLWYTLLCYALQYCGIHSCAMHDRTVLYTTGQNWSHIGRLPMHVACWTYMRAPPLRLLFPRCSPGYVFFFFFRVHFRQSMWCIQLLGSGQLSGRCRPSSTLW